MNDTKSGPSTLANNIRFLRRKKGLNQEELAQKIGIKRSNIAAYEAKNVEPRLRIILKMAKFFDVDLSEFISLKMTKDSMVAAFGQSKQDKTDPSHDSNELLQTVNTKEFIEMSMKVKKILIGIKTFHSLKKAQVVDVVAEREKLLVDIDNFILLMEHLLLENETMVKALTAKEKSIEE